MDIDSPESREQPVNQATEQLPNTVTQTTQAVTRCISTCYAFPLIILSLWGMREYQRRYGGAHNSLEWESFPHTKHNQNRDK